MAENSKIQWTTHTMNPWRGCTKISPGCTNCYADTMSGRNPKVLGVWGPNGTRVVAAESMWKEPIKWDRLAKEAGERHRVFCASLADVFEDWSNQLLMSDGKFATINRHMGKFTGYHGSALRGGNDALFMQDVRNRLFALIDATPNLDWLLLTKRPENIATMMPMWRVRDVRENPELCENQTNKPRPNVWLGVSVEDKKRADERLPLLLQIPAAVRFLSVEPLLGPIEFSNVGNRSDCVQQLGKKALAGIDWAIVGGESGHGARPMQIAWARSIVNQCKGAGVACFVKQLGAHPIEVDVTNTASGVRRQMIGLKLIDGKGGDIEEWPEDLRVREFPQPRMMAS